MSFFLRTSSQQKFACGINEFRRKKPVFHREPASGEPLPAGSAPHLAYEAGFFKKSRHRCRLAVSGRCHAIGVIRPNRTGFADSHVEIALMSIKSFTTPQLSRDRDLDQETLGARAAEQEMTHEKF
ncbi:MAG: hypothetical protein AAFY05_26340 [Pseudomonadota bacterium]